MQNTLKLITKADLFHKAASAHQIRLQLFYEVAKLSCSVLHSTICLNHLSYFF